jgi:hypothetical protein
MRLWTIRSPPAWKLNSQGRPQRAERSVRQDRDPAKMSGHRHGRPSYLVYCLLAVILVGSYVLLSRFQDDNSATMAPNLTFNR